MPPGDAVAESSVIFAKAKQIMLYLIHHPQEGQKPSLTGETAKDVIAIRFSEKEAIAALPEIPAVRQRFGLSTGTLYVSAGGKLMHKFPATQDEVKR
jgi:hypothetical protein